MKNIFIYSNVLAPFDSTTLTSFQSIDQSIDYIILACRRSLRRAAIYDVSLITFFLISLSASLAHHLPSYPYFLLYLIISIFLFHSHTPSCAWSALDLPEVYPVLIFHPPTPFRSLLLCSLYFGHSSR
jgi:hypothetical protein